MGVVVGLRLGWSTFNLTFFAAVRRRFAPDGARSFSLLAQRKRNQKKGTPACAPFGFAPGLRGFADGPSLARRRTGRRPVGHPCGPDPPPVRRAWRGPGSATRCPLREPAKFLWHHKTRVLADISRFVAWRFRACHPYPLGRRWSAEDQARQGGRQDVGHFSAGHGWPVRKTPQRGTHSPVVVVK